MKSELNKKQPYFMKNKKWYFYDEKENMFKLTKDAPIEAINSYNKIFTTTDDKYVEEHCAEYKAYINEEIMKINDNKEELELFGID